MPDGKNCGEQQDFRVSEPNGGTVIVHVHGQVVLQGKAIRHNVGIQADLPHGSVVVQAMTVPRAVRMRRQRPPAYAALFAVACLFPKKKFRRVFHPILADYSHEYASARTKAKKLSLVLYYLCAFVKALGLDKMLTLLGSKLGM
jgi:hypothetical protein